MNFVEVNRNPKQNNTDDCQTRALVDFLGITYQQASFLFARAMGQSGHFYNVRANTIYLLKNMLGCETHEIDKSLTVNALSKIVYERVYCFVRGHAVCVDVNAYYDTWDSGKRKVEVYYTISEKNKQMIRTKLNYFESLGVF